MSKTVYCGNEDECFLIKERGLNDSLTELTDV